MLTASLKNFPKILKEKMLKYEILLESHERSCMQREDCKASNSKSQRKKMAKNLLMSSGEFDTLDNVFKEYAINKL